MSQQPPQPPFPPGLSAPSTFGGPLPMPSKTSGLAVASLILGILGLCTGGVAGLIGLPLGIAALISISKKPMERRGKGLAIAGMSVSAASLVAGCFALGIFLPALGKARENAMRTKAQSSFVIVAKAEQTYQYGHDGSLPPVDDWVNALDTDLGIELGPLIESPFARGEGRACAMNARLRGRLAANVKAPSRTVMFFESRPGAPLCGASELLPPKPRSRTGYLICYVDGHVEFVPQDQLPLLIWDP